LELSFHFASYAALHGQEFGANPEHLGKLVRLAVKTSICHDVADLGSRPLSAALHLIQHWRPPTTSG